MKFRYYHTYKIHPYREINLVNYISTFNYIRVNVWTRRNMIRARNQGSKSRILSNDSRKAVKTSIPPSGRRRKLWHEKLNTIYHHREESLPLRTFYGIFKPVFYGPKLVFGHEGHMEDYLCMKAKKSTKKVKNENLCYFLWAKQTNRKRIWGGGKG